MDSFVWDSCFVTGLATVDEQHHHLVDVINRYGELLMQAQGASPQQLEQVFADLADYAQYHFQEEEELMVRHRVDARHRDGHYQQHQDFLQEVTRLQAQVTGGEQTAGRPLLNFLIGWLAYHILGCDQVMSRQNAARSSVT